MPRWLRHVRYAAKPAARVPPVVDVVDAAFADDPPQAAATTTNNAPAATSARADVRER
jgi:hypothetical protein